MSQSPEIRCECGLVMRRCFGSPRFVFSRWGNRPLMKPDRPTNREYQAHMRYEKSGSEHDRKKWLAERGETP